LPALLAVVVLAFLALAGPAARAADRRDAGAGPPTPRETVEKVMEIVNRPEFEGSDQDEEGLLLILANMLSDLVDAVKRLRRTDPVVYGAIVAWLLVTLLTIVGHVAWTVWKGGAAPGPRAAGVLLLDPALATRAGRDPDRMLARADRAASGGRPADGVPWLYLALLFRLERAGRVEYDPARTGLEYADALARRPADRRLWNEFLDLKDPVVFGTRDCAAEEFADLRRRALAPLPEEPRGPA
jgi:hypothetical protein